MISFKTKNTKKLVAETMNRLYTKGLTTTSGGNVSCRKDHKVYITPSQTDKGNMKPKEVGIVKMNGENQTPHLKLSMETQMHLAVYETRPEITAIVHAHPFTATALSADEGLIDTKINGEARAMLGIPAFAAYQTMGTKELAAVVAECTKKANAVILQHHGMLTVGEHLLQAFDRLELLEMTARANVLRNIMQIENKISPDQIKILDEMFHS